MTGWPRMTLLNSESPLQKDNMGLGILGEGLSTTSSKM